MSEPPDPIVTAELADDETLLWHGQPRQGFYISRGHWTVLAFIVVGCLTQLTLGMLPPGLDLGEKAFRIGICLGWLFFFCGLIWLDTRLDSRRSARTYYALTGRRVLRILLGHKSRSIPLERVAQVFVSGRWKTRADVVVTTVETRWWGPLMFGEKPLRLLQVRNARNVVQAIENAKTRLAEVRTGPPGGGIVH